MDGIYKVAIPITSEGLLISISSPKACLESVMPSYYCIFAGYRKCHDGSTADVEKQQLIHQIGDYIIEVEEHSTFQLSLIEVRELVKVKMSMKKNMNMHFLQLGLKSISVAYKEYLDYQRIQKSEEEQALAQEFKRVYWRESKRKYCSQLSEQEREAAVNVSTPFQIAKARLSSAYYCNQELFLRHFLFETIAIIVY